MSHTLAVYGFIRSESRPKHIPEEICKLCLLWFNPINTVTVFYGEGNMKKIKYRLFEYLKPKSQLYHTGWWLSVIEVINTNTNKSYAVKKQYDIFAWLDDAKNTLKSIKLQTHFNHPNIMHLYDVIPPKSELKDSFKSIITVLPLTGVSLKKMMDNSKQFTVREVGYITYQICTGLSYMHSCGVVHANLKPDAILINPTNLHIRICNLGYCKPINSQITDEHQRELINWKPSYQSPEALCGAKIITSKMDTWAVGCIAAELLNGKPLFNEDKKLDQIYAIFECMGTPNDLSWIESKYAKKLVKQFGERSSTESAQSIAELLKISTNVVADCMDKLLKVNPNQRINATMALELEWFRDFHVESNDVYNGELIELETFEKEIRKQKKIKGLRDLMYLELHKFYQIAPQKWIDFQ